MKNLPKLHELSFEEYARLKHSGMFWVWYPEATGDYYCDVGNYTEVGEWIEEDIVKKPNHYQLLPEYEVKHVIKALLDKIDESDFEMSSYECGWLQQALQYQMRFYAKNGLEDLEKAYETLGFVIEEMKKG